MRSPRRRSSLFGPPATLTDDVTCSVETGRALVRAGLHPATGGDGLAVCSGDMLLQALVACAGVTLGAVSTSLGIPLRDARLVAEGDLDFRGTLGVARDVPVGFRAIRLSIRTRHRRVSRAAGQADCGDRALLRGVSDAADAAAGQRQLTHSRSRRRPSGIRSVGTAP